MNTENFNEKQADESQNTMRSIDESRRSFSKRGLVAPVLLSFVSKTVWGQSIDQCTTSGNLSGNTSPGHQYHDNCDATNPFGVSPGYWLNNNGLPNWPISQSTKFNSIFTCRTVIIQNKNSSNIWVSYSSDPSLIDALEVAQNGKLNGQGTYRIRPSSGGSDNSLANDVFHAIAGYLNANMATYAYPFSQSYVLSSFCSKDMALIKGFQADSVIHGGRDVVKQWLISNGLYLN